MSIFMMWMKEGMTGFMTDSSPWMDENLAYCPGGREGGREGKSSSAKWDSLQPNFNRKIKDSLRIY
jgi:hypothetical protein